MAGTVGINFSIGAALGSTVASAFGTVSSRVKGLRADLRGLEAQSNTAGRLSAARAKMEKNQAQYAAAPTDKMRAAVRTSTIAYKNAKTAAAEYGISLETAGHAQEKLAQRIERTQAALSRQQRLQANQAKRKELQGEVMGIAATALTVAAPIKLAIEYESDFADLKKVADFASKEQEKRVQQDIFAVSKRSGINAAGMTKIAAAAGESGVANDAQGNFDPEKLKQFLNDAAEMSVAYGISAEEAGKRLAIFQSRMTEDGMALNAAQTRELGDAMNYLASKTNASAAATSSVVSRFGAVGSTAGLSIKSIAGLAGALVSTSESPEVAGTAMKSFLLALVQGEAMSKTQKEAFTKIGLGNVKGLAEGMKKGGAQAENTIMTVFEALRKMPEAEQAGIAKEIFGLESFGSIAPLINDPKKLQEAFRLANSKEAVGSQLREFETRSNTTQGAIDRLKASMGILGITVGSVLLPPLAAAANIASTMLTPITALAERFPTVTKVVMMAGIALVALKVGALAGSYAATMLSDGWTIAKGVLKFFYPSAIKTNVALLRQRGAALAAATGTRIMGAGARVAAAGQWLLNVALSANPIGIVVVAVAALVGWFAYAYSQAGSLSGAFSMMWGQLKVGMPVLHLLEAAVTGTFQFIKDLVNGVSLYDAGAKLLGTFVDGFKSMFGQVKSNLTAVWDYATSFFGGDENKAAALEAAKPTTVAEPLKPAHASAASSPAPGGAVASPPAALSRGGGQSAPSGGGASGINFNLNFSINGVADGDFASRVMGGLKSRKGELEALIADIIGEQKRLAYGS